MVDRLLSLAHSEAFPRSRRGMGLDSMTSFIPTLITLSIHATKTAGNLSSSFDKSAPNYHARFENVVPQSPLRLRVGCVIHSLDGGGAERVMAGLASRLARRGHEVDLITLDDGQRNRHPLDTSVRRLPLDVLSTPERRVSLWTRLRRLRVAIRTGGYDVVLSFCDATNLLAMLATRGLHRRVPIVLSERSDPAQQSLGRVREWLRSRLYRRADAVICLSDDVKATLRSRMSVDPIVIPSAVDEPPADYAGLRRADQTRRELAAKMETPPIRFIAIGRLEREKGFERLLAAFAILGESSVTPPWTLKILGDGSLLESLQTFSQQHGLDAQIQFAGWVDSVWPHLAQADVFILPSFYEGFPSAMLEAMSGGLAVVAVDAGGGVRTAIRHGENGWLVENAFSPLLGGLELILNDSELRARMAKAAPEVCQRFSWEATVDAYERVLIESGGLSPRATEYDTMRPDALVAPVATKE